MHRLSKFLYQLAMLLTILNLHFFSTHATPTFRVSQLSSLSTDLSPRTQPLSNTATTLTNHPKRAVVVRGTFLSGLWTFVITTATFLAQAPSSSMIPASNIEYFAQQILDKVATRIASGGAEKATCGWALDGISIKFASWIDPRTGVAPGVPWAVVEEFVMKMVLWRAQRGMAVAFSGNIWGPGTYMLGSLFLLGTRARVTEQIE